MNNNGCSTCGLRHQCICKLRPNLTPNWRLVLLTHPNEFRRDTNTGQLLATSMEHCEVMEWHRKEPPAQLVKYISDPTLKPVVLFPNETSQLLDTNTHVVDDKTWLFILLDGTWQEAKKMHNRSNWLQALPHCHLAIAEASSYQLRRNQKQGNLCTCEVGIHLLKATHNPKAADSLNEFFQHYLQVFQADKSGHLWQSSKDGAFSSSGSPK